MLLAVDLYKYLIDIEGIAVASVLAFQSTCINRSEFDTPEADRFPTDRDASLDEKVFDGVYRYSSADSINMGLLSWQYHPNASTTRAKPQGAPIATGRTGEPDPPSIRSGKIIAQNSQTPSAVISVKRLF